MDKEKLNELQGKVGASLEKQIVDLEQITADLTEDIKNSTGTERGKNMALLQAAETLLQNLRDAQKNIADLIDRNRAKE